MQSRRHENFESQSAVDRRRRNTDVGRDGYLGMSPRSKRSWSPRKMEAPVYSDRAMASRRSSSMERRAFDDGGRRIRSRSPPYMEAKRGRPFYKGDWVTERDLASPERRSRYEFFDHMDRRHDDVDYSSARNEYGYGHGSSRPAVRDDKLEVRRFDSGFRELSSQKSAAMGGLYKATGDVGPISKPEHSGDLTSASLNIGLGQIGKEGVHYPDVRDSYSFDKFASVKHYGDDDKIMAHPRDTSYPNLTAIRSKELIGASHFKDYARTSPRKSGIDHLDYRGGMNFARDSPPLNPGHMPEPLPQSRYEQRQHLDLHRDTDHDINDDMVPYREERFSPPRTGHLDSFRLPPRTREKDDYLYSSGEMYEKMDLHERVGYNGRDVLEPNLLDRVTHRAEASDMAHRNMSSRRSLDRIPITGANSFGLSRSPAGKRESAQYLDTVSIHSRLGRKVTGEDEMPYMGMAQDHEIERTRVDYDYNRGLSSGSYKERMRSFEGPLYDREHKMEGHDLPPYDSSSRYLKRKGTMEDEENRIPSRNMMSRLDTVYRRHNRDFRDEEWIDQDAGRSHFSERTHKVYDDDEYIYDPDEYNYDHDHDHRMRSHTYDDKHGKGYSRSSGRVGHNSYYPNRRNVIPRWKNVPIRSENDKDADMYSSEVEQYEPHEDTKEFKQLVNDYFLSFTKKLYENSVVRRRYMEQGRAGSLFCIVCGRSLSKEFLDAQRLAMHAFMSHKGGLRAQHLGLLKAMCVMLGWKSVLPADTSRWFPETLSSTESLAQKQDLIIWPPVVIIHNISIVNNSSGEGPTTVEALGQYLRGIGFTGGKIKVGRPANCSIMLVKFLGTFSGLQDAEKMHEYFSKKKHGRKHLEQVSSNKGKSNWEDREAERVLFGFMGIAEDLDKVDIDTKRKCSIKSKKEIQDIADAPVKPGE